MSFPHIHPTPRTCDHLRSIGELRRAGSKRDWGIGTPTVPVGAESDSACVGRVAVMTGGNRAVERMIHGGSGAQSNSHDKGRESHEDLGPRR